MNRKNSLTKLMLVRSSATTFEKLRKRMERDLNPRYGSPYISFQHYRFIDAIANLTTNKKIAEFNVAPCVAHLNVESPDRILLVEVWPNISEAIRVGIVAMVETSRGRSSDND